MSEQRINKKSKRKQIERREEKREGHERRN